MFDFIWKGIFDTEYTSVITPGNFLLCIAVALITGFILAKCYMYRSQHTKSFVATLAVLPAAVCVVIMMVNGNIGTGVAIAGAFSLVRFRSASGTAKEISSIFIAMAIGLMTGMGYLAYAIVSTLLFCIVTTAYTKFDFGSCKNGRREKTLRITIPEDLDYTDVFDSILNKYTDAYELVQVKTTNMGSLFRLTYDLTLKDISQEKEMINDLRCRNGNLEISISTHEMNANEL